MFSYDISVDPAFPWVNLRIIDTFSSLEFPVFPAKVDTGADCSCIPQWVVSEMPNFKYTYRRVADAVSGIITKRKFVYMRQLKNSKPFIIKKFLKIPIRDQPIVN